MYVIRNFVNRAGLRFGWLDGTFSVFNWILRWFWDLEISVFGLVLKEDFGYIRGPNWLGEPSWAMGSIIMANVWRGLPFFAISFLAALQTVPTELYNRRISPFLVRDPTIEHWRMLFQDTLFLPWAWNTLWIAVVSTGLSLFAGVLGGYALSRLMFPGSTVFSIWIFITCLVPPALLFIPLTGVTGELILGDVYFRGPLMAGALFGSVPVATSTRSSSSTTSPE